MNDYFRITTDAQGIATLVLDRAGHSMNLIDSACVEQLDAAIGQLAGDAAVRGVILTSGKEAFLAGADLNELVALYDSGLDRATLAQRAGRYSAVLRRMETCGKPFAAALNGTALGGGLELALACDLRVADPDAVLGLPELALGSVPSFGAIQRLPGIVGRGRAADLLLSGRRIDGREAERIGLVTRLSPPGGALATAMEVAQSLADRPREAVRYLKLALRGAFVGDAAAELHGLVSDACHADPDYQARIARFAAGKAGRIDPAGEAGADGR